MASNHETSVQHDVDSEEDMIHYKGRMGMMEMGLEDVDKYNKGGFHPIHLDDVLDDRFHVAQKLGHGGFGTVWLCRDLKLNKWRAVKVIAAKRSTGSSEEKVFDYLRKNCTLEELEENHIMVPLEEFWIDGPNGRHRCLVMPVLGWPVSDWRIEHQNHKEETNEITRNVCREIIKALNFLHGHGICHGDFRPGNILMKIEGFDDLDNKQLEELMGGEELWNVETVSGQPLSPRAPKYLVESARYGWSKTLSTGSIAVVDFGESFFDKDPPRTTGIPDLWAAPEVLFEGSRPIGLPSDVWSLACTLCEVRTEISLFSSWLGGFNQRINRIEHYLGPLPWYYWKAYRKMLADMRRKRSHGDQREQEGSQHELGEDTEKTESESGQSDEETEYPNMFFEDLLSEQSAHDHETNQSFKYRFPEKEMVELGDLLYQMLKYEPGERIKTSSIISHPWVGY
ncbi:kinase-like domain-containing protein [Annulohypoxylon moriforme]|nr:kinase-like domain-containing protein [Annulohypoxylon moriforme]